MAFIVEMWWGRAHEIEMQDVDENGELYVKEIITTGSPDPERRAFSCHGDNWRMALALGRAFGWRPQGARLRPWRGDEQFLPDPCYEPDGWIRGVHEVEADDAQEWAAAIELCLKEVQAGRFHLPEMRSSVVLREGMTLDEYRQANRGLTLQFLGAFGAFLRTGAFRFGWDS